MTKRRTFISVSALTAAMLPLSKALGQTIPLSQTGTEDKADFLFVQTSNSLTYDPVQSTLTLVGVSPVTLFFSDRPNRIAGNMTTESFIPFWSTGTDSFLADPPNADVSILEGNTLKQVVVVLKDPVLKDGDLTYTISVLDGTMPATGKNVSVFIDIIGCPLTPVSYAGVARRSYARAVVY
ncbi:MAG TPA: hypothetical protein IGR64_15425 [Leptolyngbyaceae cyanobacterium M65_K2018_010]|nr:hypothetical protein [Leptolyngbyaceae cyanobacterium M65_K2018_010]